MFNLVKYRYWFLIVSLIVIIPGTISLFVNGLKLGIDFAGGSSVELRPQQQITTTGQVRELLAPLKLQDLQVTFSTSTKEAPNNIFWVRLNTQIDSNVQKSIQDAVQAKYPEAKIDIRNISTSADGKNLATVVVLTNFKQVPQVSDIQSLLSKLPNTTDPTKSPMSTTTPPSPATPTAQATAGATPTGTVSTQATPKASSTPNASTTPNSTDNTNSAATLPVSVQEIKQGQTAQTVSLLTRSTITTANEPNVISISAIQSAFLNGKGGTYTSVVSNSEVGPSVATDTTRNAILAVLAAAAFILIYIWFSFRKIAKAWRYGTCAIIAMLHDVLVVLGIFSILGWLFNMQIDALFITALLTVVGFSVHDTIVVFDRIRENMQRHTVETFEDVVNASLVQTMARSLNTSLTVLFTLLALTLFTGIGTNIHTFTLTLLIGIFSGTYSSIFNASMLLVIWEHGELGLWRLNRGQERPVTRRAREEREPVHSRG